MSENTAGPEERGEGLREGDYPEEGPVPSAVQGAWNAAGDIDWHQVADDIEGAAQRVLVGHPVLSRALHHEVARIREPLAATPAPDTGAEFGICPVCQNIDGHSFDCPRRSVTSTPDNEAWQERMNDWPEPAVAHPDDGHDHRFTCIRCGVDTGAEERLRAALTFDPEIAPEPIGRVRRKWWRLGWLSALAVARDRVGLPLSGGSVDDDASTTARS